MELNFVFVKLVEYFGYYNMMVLIVVFNEIMNFVEFYDVMIVSFFWFFWLSLVFLVVKDFVLRLQIIQLVVEFFQISIYNFLKML